MKTYKKLSTKKGSRTSGQISRIWGIAKKGLRIEDDLLYTMMFETTGCIEMGDLSEKQADAFLRQLLTNLASMKRSVIKRTGPTPIDSYRRTPEQERIAKDLIEKIQIGGRPIDLDSMSDRMYKKPFNQLNRYRTQGVIEALKSIYVRDGGLPWW